MTVAPYHLLSIPTISLLLGIDRTWAFRRTKSGAFGHITTIAGEVYATLAGVERYAGRPVTSLSLPPVCSRSNSRRKLMGRRKAAASRLKRQLCQGQS